jgi:hypothetical protein
VTVTTIDPATGELLATYDETPLEEVEAILQRAHDRGRHVPARRRAPVRREHQVG